jgi:hypothetical protein
MFPMIAGWVIARGITARKGMLGHARAALLLLIEEGEFLRELQLQAGLFHHASDQVASPPDLDDLRIGVRDPLNPPRGLLTSPKSMTFGRSGFGEDALAFLG